MIILSSTLLFYCVSLALILTMSTLGDIGARSGIIFLAFLLSYWLISKRTMINLLLAGLPVALSWTIAFAQIFRYYEYHYQRTPVARRMFARPDVERTMLVGPDVDGTMLARPDVEGQRFYLSGVGSGMELASDQPAEMEIDGDRARRELSDPDPVSEKRSFPNLRSIRVIQTPLPVDSPDPQELSYLIDQS